MSVVAKLLALLSAALLPLGLVGAWAERVVTDTDAYVAAVAPLADEPAVQGFVTSRLLDVVGAQVPPGLLGPAGERLLERATRRVVSSDRFAAVWRSAHAQVHRQLVAALEADDQRPLVLRLDPLVDGVRDAIQRELGLPVAPPIEASLAVRVASPADTARAREAYRLVDALFPAVPLVWGATLVLALLPRRRRRSTLAVAAAASALTSLALWAVVDRAGPVVAAAAEARRLPLDEAVVRAVYAGLTDGLAGWALLAAGASAVVLVAALVRLPGHRAAARRD